MICFFLLATSKCRRMWPPWGDVCELPLFFLPSFVARARLVLPVPDKKATHWAVLLCFKLNNRLLHQHTPEIFYLLVVYIVVIPLEHLNFFLNFRMSWNWLHKVKIWFESIKRLHPAIIESGRLIQELCSSVCTLEWCVPFPPPPALCVSFWMISSSLNCFSFREIIETCCTDSAIQRPSLKFFKKRKQQQQNGIEKEYIQIISHSFQKNKNKKIIVFFCHDHQGSLAEDFSIIVKLIKCLTGFSRKKKAL